MVSYDRCTPSGRSSTRIVTGAYDPASGTCFAISFMMSGLPITRRTIFGCIAPGLLAQNRALIELHEHHQPRLPEALFEPTSFQFSEGPRDPWSP